MYQYKKNHMPSHLLIASGVIIVENNAVLVVREEEDVFWKVPGGRLESFDENFRQAARREIKEEVGIEVTLLEREPFFMYVRKTEDVDVLLVHFLATRIGEIVPGVDIRAWKWMPLDALEEPLAPNIQPALKWFGFR